jgi:hypothetical protein
MHYNGSCDNAEHRIVPWSIRTSSELIPGAG